VAEEFGLYFARIPLVTSPHIRHANALTTDWNEVLPAQRCSYVLGNPPFVGKHYQSAEQKAELLRVFHGVRSASDLDFVAAWYGKAAPYIQNSAIRCAFVSTNSITQGEQVPILWPLLFERYGIRIHFAHRTFQWSNEARGVAAVHCVIIGFGAFDVAQKTIFDYDSPRSDAHAIAATNISPYLADAEPIVVQKRQTPLGPVPEIRCGGKPSDGGNLVMDATAMESLVRREPRARKFLHPYVGSEEFINGGQRWCLRLEGAAPSELRHMPAVLECVEAVRRFRLASTAAPTRAAAATPTRFFFESQPAGEYIAIPEVSSERRNYVPIGILPPTMIASNKLYLVESASRYLFGVLQSAMHMAWMRTVAGRLKSDIQYSGTMVYNTFPWPESPTDKQRAAVEAAAQGVLDARAQFPQSSLADLYDPLTMPPALTRAHQALDAAVDAAYGRRNFRNDAERVAFLFERYQAITSLLPAAAPRKGGRRASDRQPRSDAPAAT
jgi:hypothetical protein